MQVAFMKFPWQGALISKRSPSNRNPNRSCWRQKKKKGRLLLAPVESMAGFDFRPPQFSEVCFRPSLPCRKKLDSLRFSCLSIISQILYLNSYWNSVQNNFFITYLFLKFSSSCEESNRKITDLGHGLLEMASLIWTHWSKMGVCGVVSYFIFSSLMLYLSFGLDLSILGA